MYTHLYPIRCLLGAFVAIALSLPSTLWGASASVIVDPPAVSGDPGTTVAVTMEVTTPDQIGFLQFTLEYDSAVADFVSVSLDPSMPTGFAITNLLDPIGPPYSYAPDTDRNVLVQIAGNGVTHFFTGNQTVATLTFALQPDACGSSPLNFTTVCQRTHLSTLNLETICAPTTINSSITSSDPCVTDVGNSPRRTGLIVYPNNPNPFNPSTTIRFDLAESQRVAVRVFDPAGRMVRHLYGAIAPQGINTVTWNGRDDAGGPLASGVYIYRVETLDEVVSKSMVLLK
jgi:hypothetical protein